MDRRLGRSQPATATSYLLLLAVMVAIVAGALITRQTTAQAGTVGNTDIYNDNFNGGTQSSISSGWWGGASHPVTQRYGCTSFSLEDQAAGAAHGCPNDHKYWHHGLDIGVTGSLYSQLAGTIVESRSAVLGIQAGDGIVVFLIHGTPLVGAGTVRIGDSVYTVGSLLPCGGSSTGAHLHFEVHRSGYPFCNNLNDDINPEEWLNTQCSLGGPLDAIGTYSGSIGATSYLNWYDNASVGFNADTIHVYNPTSSYIPGVSVSLAGVATHSTSMNPGQEWYTNFSGQLGGPVSISGAGTLASRRTQFNSSFDETNAVIAPSTDQFLPWFDKASVGFCSDNVHVTNSSSSSANATIAIPGMSASKLIPSGKEWYFSWPAGTMNGPIEISSDVPVIASERVQYMHSFNEVNAIPAANISQQVWFTWYDNATHEFRSDDIHVVNPDRTNACSVSIAGPGGASIPAFSVGPLGDHYAHFPGGTYGGPVSVSVTNPSTCRGVLAYQRATFNGSFSELDGMPASAAGYSFAFNWYDHASTGFADDQFIIADPGPSSSTGCVYLNGASCQSFTLGAGQAQNLNFGPTLGGAVTVVVTYGSHVLASERVQYYSSFHEVDPLGMP